MDEGCGGDDLMLFWDRRGVVAVARHDGACGRPAGKSAGVLVLVLHAGAREYHPGFYGVNEQMNAIWHQTNLDDFD